MSANDRTQLTLAEAIDAAAEVTDLVKKLTAKQKAYQEYIKDHLLTGGELPDTGSKLVLGNEYGVKVTVNKGRVTFDKAAAVADGVDVSKYEKTGAPFLSLSFTAIS